MRWCVGGVRDDDILKEEVMNDEGWRWFPNYFVEWCDFILCDGVCFESDEWVVAFWLEDWFRILKNIVSWWLDDRSMGVKGYFLKELIIDEMVCESDVRDDDILKEEVMNDEGWRWFSNYFVE